MPREATAAVALERLAYLVGTTHHRRRRIDRSRSRAAADAACGSACSAAFAIARRHRRAFLTAIVIAGRGTYLQSWLAADRSAARHVARRRTGWAVRRQPSSGRCSSSCAANPARLAVLLDRDDRRVRLHGARGVGDSPRLGCADHADRRAGGRDVLPRRELRVRVHPRESRRARSVEPCRGRGGRRDGGGAALALARRLRGLFWAGVGLAIYPRRAQPVAAGATDDAAPPAAPRGRARCSICPHDAAVSVPPSARLAGLAARRARAAPGAARRLRPHHRLAARTATCRRRRHARRLRALALRRRRRRHDRRDGTRMARRAGRTSRPPTPVTAIGAGTVVSHRAAGGRARSSPVDRTASRDVPAGPDWPESGVLRLTARDARRSAARRRRAARERRDAGAAAAVRRGRRRRPRAGSRCASTTPADLAGAEQTIRRSSYKDTDAKVARFNRRMSLPISVALIRTPLTRQPAVGDARGGRLLLRVAVQPGHYSPGSLGAFLSLAASVLDGCDGEIARLKYQESALGCWIETFGDYSYYIAIFIGLTIGAVRQTRMGGLLLGRRRSRSAGTLLVVRAADLPARRASPPASPRQLHAIARERFQAEPTLLVARHLAGVVRRHARGDAVRHHGVRARRTCCPAIVVLAAHRREHLLGRASCSSCGTCMGRRARQRSRADSPGR